MTSQDFRRMAQDTVDNATVEAKSEPSPDQFQVMEVVRQSSFTDDIGYTGLRRNVGYIDEEFLPQLKGRKGVQVFREMADNEPLVGGLLHAITMLLRNVDWTVKPGGKSAKDTKAAEFLESCKDDMEQPWSEFISEVLSMLTFGWSMHEIVLKHRVGPWEEDPSKRSKHSDGLVGIRKMPIRAQETLLRWVFDDRGDVSGMIQMAAPHYRMVTIPMQKSMLFRLWAPRGNPEGRSLLRTSYRPYYMKKRIEEFEAVGVERDLAGMPVAKVPAEYLTENATTSQKKTVAAMKKLVRSVRRNEQDGLVFPSAYDQDTKQPLFDFSLLASGGGRQFPTDPIIQRYEQRILMSVLADFIMVGHQQTGSYSLHTDKTGIFRTTLNAIAQSIADTLNRTLVPTLFKANGMTDLEQLPEFEPNDVDSPDIAVLAQFMSSMASMGISWFPDATLEKFVRKAARLPDMDEDEERREQMLARRAEATRFMQQQQEYVQTRMGLQQAVAGVGPQAPEGQPGAPGQPGQPGQPAAGQPGQPPGQAPGAPPGGGATPAKQTPQQGGQ